MYQSKSGKRFGSIFAGRKKDAMDAQHEAAETPEFEKGEQEGMKEKPEAVESTDPKQVVAKHGKASSVSVTHDYKANKHQVVSTHPDGHVHTSDHPSSKDAHNEAQQLAGESTLPTETEEPTAAPESDGFVTPRLA